MRGHNCRKCGAECSPSPSRIDRGEIYCRPCTNEAKRRWCANRKAVGNPVISTKVSAEYWAEYEKRPLVARKKRIRGLTKLAIQRGLIKREPCQECGAPNSEVHHTTYDCPDQIAWLCKTHHHQEHNRLKAVEA